MWYMFYVTSLPNLIFFRMKSNGGFMYNAFLKVYNTVVIFRIIVHIAVARSFTQCLKRRAGISHMATVARAFLHSSDMVLKLHHDWKLLDVTAVAHECCTLVDDDGTEHHRQHCRIRKCESERRVVHGL